MEANCINKKNVPTQHKSPHIKLIVIHIPAMEVPKQMHMKVPMNQHHTTEAGPPSRRGVFKVVATEDETPMMLKAKEMVCAR